MDLNGVQIIVALKVFNISTDDAQSLSSFLVGTLEPQLQAAAATLVPNRRIFRIFANRWSEPGYYRFARTFPNQGAALPLHDILLEVFFAEPFQENTPHTGDDAPLWLCQAFGLMKAFGVESVAFGKVTQTMVS